MPFTTNAAQLAQRYARRAADVRAEQRREAGVIARGVSQEAHNQMRRLIYSVPVPRSSTGRALWVRSRKLLEKERARVVNGADVVLENNRPYAGVRHEKTQFVYMHPAPWRRVTIRNKRRWVQERRHAALLRALRGR
jgi:hypothetical protein